MCVRICFWVLVFDFEKKDFYGHLVFASCIFLSLRFGNVFCLYFMIMADSMPDARCVMEGCLVSVYMDCRGREFGSGCVHGWICMYVVAIYLFLNALSMYRDEGSKFVCAIM